MGVLKLQCYSPISPHECGQENYHLRLPFWLLSTYKTNLYRTSWGHETLQLSLISPRKCGQENYLLRLPFWVSSMYKTNLYKTGRGHETLWLSQYLLRLPFWSRRQISPIWDQQGRWDLKAPIKVRMNVARDLAPVFLLCMRNWLAWHRLFLWMICIHLELYLTLLFSFPAAFSMPKSYLKRKSVQ